MVVTLLIAILQQANARAERQILFNAAATTVQQNLADTVDSKVQEFRSGINFIAATHPGPLDEYQTFFSREDETAVDIDPGVLFIEFVSRDEINRLTARERLLGNGEINVTLLPGSAEERAILTRLVSPSSVFGRPLLGFDVTLMQDQLIPEQLGDEGFELFVLDSIAVAELVEVTASNDPSFDEYRDYTAFLVGEVTDRDGELLGYSVRFQAVSGLLKNITPSQLSGLSVELYAEGIDEPVAGRRSPGSPSIADATLVDSRDVVTSSMTWHIDVWADPDFGPAVGLFLDQAWVWLAGTIVSAGAYGASVRRRRHRHTLDTARFELAHARTLAETDALTGLLNRHGLIDAARQTDANRAATIFFIDLDGFKSVNDSDGHDRGDQVLGAVAATLRSVFRPDDLVARIGGDEFVVFTHCAGSSNYISAISKRINRAVSEIDDRVTCSLGVASRESDQQTDVKDLLRAADIAMYEAKRSGGDRYAINNPG